jgi:hypothetical protein
MACHPWSPSSRWLIEPFISNWFVQARYFGKVDLCLQYLHNKCSFILRPPSCQSNLKTIFLTFKKIRSLIRSIPLSKFECSQDSLPMCIPRSVGFHIHLCLKSFIRPKSKIVFLHAIHSICVLNLNWKHFKHFIFIFIFNNAT